MAKQIIEEMQLRNCLATIAGADPNGCMFTVTEIRNSDVAVAVAFGAIGSAIHAAANDKPQGYLVNYAPAGIYFVPMYYQRKTGMVLAPEQNFFIPHTDIARLTVVRAGMTVQINLKTNSGRKFKFQTNRKLRGQEYHARNVEQFRSIYAEMSKKAQRRRSASMVAAIAFLVVLFAGLIVLVSLPEDNTAPSNSGAAAAGNYKAADESENLPYYSIDGLFFVRIPESFTDWTAEEINAEYTADEVPGLVSSDASGNVRVEITAEETNLTDADVVAVSAESGYSVTERDGVHFAEHESVETTENGSLYTSSTLFVQNGQKITVTFRCPSEQRSVWETTSDAIIGSVCISDPQA